MKLLIAALLLTLALAGTGAAFAIWPVVADAPWEEEAAQPPADRTREIRCEAALRLRDTATAAIGRLPVRQPVGRITQGGSSGGVDQRQLAPLEDQLARAEREITRYC